MSMKNLPTKITSRIGKQMLVAQKHSPTMLVSAGVVGFAATVVLACRATMKMCDALDKSEEVLLTFEADKVDDEGKKEEIKKKTYNVKLLTAIEIAKAYAPAVAVGMASLACFVGSHRILTKRNAGLSAAYAIVSRSLKEYRERVIADQGPKKDLEYRFGSAEREIVEEGPNGPEVRVIKGLDQEAVKAAEKRSYARVFDPSNTNWSDTPHQNQYFIQMVENHSNKMLVRNGWVSLNDVYDQLGFRRTRAGQRVGWSYNPKRDPQTGEIINDCEVDFGIWDKGVYKGKEWINGNPGAILLDFNVDGEILGEIEEEM